MATITYTTRQAVQVADIASELPKFHVLEMPQRQAELWEKFVRSGAGKAAQVAQYAIEYDSIPAVV